VAASIRRYNLFATAAVSSCCGEGDVLVRDKTCSAHLSVPIPWTPWRLSRHGGIVVLYVTWWDPRLVAHFSQTRCCTGRYGDGLMCFASCSQLVWARYGLPYVGMSRGCENGNGQASSDDDLRAGQTELPERPLGPEALRYWASGTGPPLVSASPMREVPARRVSITCLESSFPGPICRYDAAATVTQGGVGVLDRGVRREDDLRASGTLIAGNEEERGRQRYLSLSSAHDSAEQRVISSQHDLRSLNNKFQLELQPGPIGTVQAARCSKHTLCATALGPHALRPRLTVEKPRCYPSCWFYVNAFGETRSRGGQIAGANLAGRGSWQQNTADRE
jgi:hypothetical protein